MAQTITKHIAEGFASGELYAALAYDATDKFGGMKIKSIMHNATEREYFRDSGLYIYSSTDGQLDIAADTTLAIVAPSTTITNSYSATTGTLRSLTISHTMTAASTSNVVEALKVTITSNVKTGAWANAIVGSINYSTSGAAHGMAAAICAEMIPPNSSLARGALYALDCEIGCGASSTWASAGPVAFIKMENWGTKTHFSANGYLLHLAGETSATGALLYTNSLKIRIGTSTKYLPYSDAQQGLHLGTSGSKATLVASTPYLSAYTTSATTTGTIQSAVISQTMTATATANYIEVLNVTLTSDVKTGGNANAIFAKIDYVTNGLAHGEAGVIAAELSLPASSVVRGEYVVYKTEIDCPTNCVMNSNPIHVFGINVWGGAKAQFDSYGYLFNISGITTNDTGFWKDGTMTAGDAQETIRVKTPGGTRYIALYDSR